MYDILVLIILSGMALMCAAVVAYAAVVTFSFFSLIIYRPLGEWMLDHIYK